MSILSELDDMVLRETSNPPLTTKGAELTYAEMDERIIAVYDVVQSVVTGANVTAYDAGKTYDMYDTDIRNRYASYDSRIWEAVYTGSPSTFSGQTPEEGIYWTQVTLAEMMPNILELARFSENLVSDNDPAQVYMQTLEITTADVKLLNGTPLDIVDAPGAGKIIQPLGYSYRLRFQSVAYATNTNLQLKFDGADVAVAESNTLGGTVDRYVIFDSIPTPSAGQSQMLANTALQVTVKNGEATAGDSGIVVKVFYAIDDE